MQTTSITFDNIIPNADLESSFHVFFQSIADRAPSDSLIKVNVKKIDLLAYHVDVRVISNGKTFIAAEHSYDVVDALDKSVLSICSQLREWLYEKRA